MAKLGIIIQTSPYASGGAYSAYKYCEAALNAGHEIYRVFFYQDAVLLASSLHCLAQDEFNLAHAWQALGQDNHLDLCVCIAAAARRGIIDTAEAKRHDKAGANLLEGFSLAGLGQLIDAHVKCDRVIVFGA